MAEQLRKTVMDEKITHSVRSDTNQDDDKALEGLTKEHELLMLMRARLNYAIDKAPPCPR